MFDKWMKQQRTRRERENASLTLEDLADDRFACELLAKALEIEPENEAASFVAQMARAESERLKAEYYQECADKHRAAAGMNY